MYWTFSKSNIDFDKFTNVQEEFAYTNKVLDAFKRTIFVANDFGPTK